MSFENRIREAVLDQDHLADLLSGNEGIAQELRSRVVELLLQGRVELYTYAKGGQAVEVLSREDAVAVASEPKSWSWHTEAGTEQLYFLSPVKLESGGLAYGQ